MKSNSDKLSSFFYDIKNIEEYKSTYEGLEKLYDECVGILNRREFCDINVQDEEGNTYLHYVVKESMWKWAIRLLELGADPTIKNNEGRNAFMMAPINGGAIAFWKKIGEQGFSNFNNWENVSKVYCRNAKQAFFNYYLKDNFTTFETLGEINYFLRRNEIKSDHNEIALMANAGMSLKRDSYAWYINSYEVNDIENNNNFFVYFLNQKIFWGDRAATIAEFLSQRKISQTEQVVNTIVDVIRETQKKGADRIKKIAEALVKFMVENNFDLDKEYEIGVRQTTLRKEMEQSPVTFKMLLDNSLEDNKQKTKVKKI